MKYRISKYLLLTLSILVSIVANAYDFEVGGIYYNKDGNCAIVTRGNSEYSGDVSIPSTVNYGGMEYSVTGIGGGAFQDCTGLTSVTIPNSVTIIGYGAFYGCTGLTSVTIGNSVTSIGDYAFNNCSGLTSVTIPNSLTSIGNFAFWECTGLTSVIIPNSVATIGEGAFGYCSGLTSVTIPNSLTSIESHVFASCYSLTSVTIPNSVTSIGNSAFDGCTSLTSVTIPNSVTSIGDGAFSFCSGLTSIKVETENTTYDSRNDCNAIIETASNTLVAGCENTVIPNSVSYIGDGAFYGCTGLTSVIIPNSVTSIGYSAFTYCSGLTSVIIPNSVTSIGYSAFTYCSGLTSVTIGNSVTSIGYDAFGECSNLKSVISEIEIPFTIDSSVFGSDTENNGQLTVPNGKKSIYQSTDGWKEFSNIVESISSYTLTIQSSSGGYVSYNGANISATTKTFTIDEGSSVTFTITPDSGYRLASLTVNGTDVTTSVSNNQYTISNITANTSIVATFEQIPPTTCTLSIQSGNGGSVSYDGTTITNATKSFTVAEGSSATITITPNSGYRLSRLVVNSTDRTPYVSNNKYTISNITTNTTVAVTFEQIPVTTYTLSIQSGSGGYVSYDGTTISNTTKSFSVESGSSATISITPNSGYRLSRLVVNSTDRTSYVSNNKYTISNITTNTTVAVTFEQIPVTTYTLSIQSGSGGSVSYNGTTISNTTRSFSVESGASATITITPNSGYRLSRLVVNSTDRTSYVSNNKYTISNITTNTTVAVTFEQIPVTTYTLSIQSGSGGSVSYNGTTISNTTRSFSVESGSSATISITPNSGYRLSRLVVNSTDRTSYVSNNKYTVSNITANTTVAVTFEQIPVTTYTLSIQSGSGGSVSYDGTTITNATKSFTVAEGTSATITITPNSGYRLSRLVVNSTDRTSNVSNNQYTISNITANTTVVVTFEQIPVTTYTLSIQSGSGGSVSYNGTTISNTTKSFSVESGSSATITITPNSGYRLSRLVVNSTDRTSNVSNNQYTISNITTNTTVAVTFEQIPITTYTLSIQSGSGGYVSYDGTTISNATKSFSVESGSSATITITPNSGYRLSRLAVNSTDRTSFVSNNKYTISNITTNTTVAVTFEAIPPTTYKLTISSSGNGSAKYSGETIRGGSKSFTLNEGANATITFTPDNGYRIASVKVNNTDVTSNISNNQYTISNITANTSVVATFEIIPNPFTQDGINYEIEAEKDHTLNVGSGEYSGHVVIPATVTHGDETWTVTGVADGAFDTPAITAITWNPSYAIGSGAFGNLTNPNLLLYVKDAAYAPENVQNVIANGRARQIVLTDAASGNDFDCPKAFTAEEISYTHHYSMTTGIEECRGWETIALPFTVQKVMHQTKGQLVTFKQWDQSTDAKPYWLYKLTYTGFVEADFIEANTPYVISMPNHEKYYVDYILAGDVTFSAQNATVKTSENMTMPTCNEKTFRPCFAKTAQSSVYAINAVNNWVTNTGGYKEGSVFVEGLRSVLPFEAYMTTNAANAKGIIPIFDTLPTAIREIPQTGYRGGSHTIIFNLSGQAVMITDEMSLERALSRLPHGVYIVNGKKVVIK